MTFTEKLQRLTNGMNKSKLSLQAGLPPTSVSNYLAKGYMPGGDIAMRLARALGVSLEWLLDDDQEWPPLARSVASRVHDGYASRAECPRVVGAA